MRTRELEQTKSRGGRITKKNKATLKRLFDGIRRGIPYAMCCELAGISEESFFKWRRLDPAFDAEVIKLTQESVFSLIDTLKEASLQSWQSAAFLLERRWARFYGKPETQFNLALAVQNNVQQNGNGQTQAFEALVLGDLEFSKLRENGNYSHHAADPVIDIEAERVPEPLSGHLSRAGSQGTVISESQWAENQRRAEKTAERIDALFASKRAAGSNDQNAEGNGTAPLNALVPSMITIPQGEPTQAWWSQLVVGSTDRQIERAAAVMAVRRVIARLAGESKAKDLPIDFDGEIVTAGDVHRALETLTGGPTGYRALLTLAGRG
jgi:hypothetical protein